jgi:hypothetical protein
MKYKQFIFALAFALLSVPFAMYAQDTATPKTNTELEALIVALTARVDTLEDELDDATATIATLKAQVENDDEDDEDDEDEADTAVTPSTRGNGVAVCHNGKTLHVNVHSALTYKAQGSKLGVCTQERVKTQAKKPVIIEEDDDESTFDDSDGEED